MEINPVAEYCPYCGESIELLIDESELDQCYIEDCPVCCRPIQVHPVTNANGGVSVRLYHENEVPGV